MPLSSHATTSSSTRGAPPRRAATMKTIPSRFRSSSTQAPSADAQAWDRVMHTKLTQWRYMHLVALDSLSHSERTACAELSHLSAVLEASSSRYHALQSTLAAARVARAKEDFHQQAIPALTRLEVALSSTSTAHKAACTALLTALRRVRVATAAGIPVGDPKRIAAELEKFRDTAKEFLGTVASAKGFDTIKLTDAVEELARVVGAMEREALTRAAQAVAKAEENVAEERAARAVRVEAKRSQRIDGPVHPAAREMRLHEEARERTQESAQLKVGAQG